MSQHGKFAALETSLYGNEKGSNNGNSSNAATATKAFPGCFIRKSKSKIKEQIPLNCQLSLAQIFPDYTHTL